MFIVINLKEINKFRNEYSFIWMDTKKFVINIDIIGQCLNEIYTKIDLWKGITNQHNKLVKT